ncbi:hypothetical protein HMPREF9318_02082 [Streptococcus urinalis FB127-CNA-2]|uniref:Foldase n=1 Tax=Streptococcus urinalis 2285-97 TaxID=764291 RepID=G5KCF5_9STRE|nr:cell wall synthase accessory phosphoprotein MacP [Streptococcus urinalis]EHJ57203.1 hypothetical protein STRUR_1693 [Streptococcus urinalis 2285-97]EKS17205.1 hypothetical protein HMPREF9318_02082 [Streptococcus urinalis FB127-CNA-2]VEF32545.1 membrane protein [Streptococcus urinalis]
MGKPLLTDEMIEASKHQDQYDYFEDDQETKIIPTSQLIDDDMIDDDNDREIIYKSRRIENAKRSAFQSKLNLILIALIVLIALLVYAVFNL